MTFTPVVIDELCGEHAAIHIHYPADRVPDLIRNFERRNAFIADITIPPDSDTPEALAEHLSRELNFPEITTNWDAVDDWATDEEVIGNPVASLIVLRGLDNLIRQRPRDRELPIALWTRGPRRFQFLEQAFHAVLIGEDPPSIDIASVFQRWVPIDRMQPQMLANIGYGSDRIPVYDWQTGTPQLLIE
jgi:hypothetical protein